MYIVDIVLYVSFSWPELCRVQRFSHNFVGGKASFRMLSVAMLSSVTAGASFMFRRHMGVVSIAFSQK